MNQIEEVLREVLEQVSEFRSHYLSNEQAVRAQLIDPVLNALGWRTSNPKFVRHNTAFEDGKIPDYTLLKDGKNKLIVEAKNLSVILTDQKVIDQLAGYCYKQGVDFGILTNGVRWLLFSTFQKNPQDRIVWQVDLEKENLETASRMLSWFSFGHNIDKLDTLLQISKALEENWAMIVSSTDSIVAIIAQRLAEKIKATNPKLPIEAGEINSFTKAKLIEHFELNGGEIIEEKQAVSAGNSGEETAFSEVEDALFKRSEREKITVTFPDGTKYNYKKVVETFVETIRKIGIEKIKPLSIKISKVPLISESQHPFYQQHRIGKYWVMVNLSTKKKYALLKELDELLNLNLKIDIS